MINPPRTKEEARGINYHAGSYHMVAYEDSLCAYLVWDRELAVICYQCSRKPGHGPADLYCKQHAKMVEREAGG